MSYCRISPSRVKSARPFAFVARHGSPSLAHRIFQVRDTAPSPVEVGDT